MEQAGGGWRKGRRLRSRTNTRRASGLLTRIRRGRCNRAPNSAERRCVASPFVVRDRWSTVVRAVPILSAEYWIVTGPAPSTRLNQ